MWQWAILSKSSIIPFFRPICSYLRPGNVFWIYFETIRRGEKGDFIGNLWRIDVWVVFIRSFFFILIFFEIGNCINLIYSKCSAIRDELIILLKIFSNGMFFVIRVYQSCQPVMLKSYQKIDRKITEIPSLQFLIQIQKNHSKSLKLQYFWH